MSAQSRPVDDPDAALRDRLADAIAEEAAFDGWSRASLGAAARRLELPTGEADRLFPGGKEVLYEALRRRDSADLRKPLRATSSS